jgi:hypothetical protein
MAMAPSPQLNLVQKAIRSGIYGHIQWKDSAARLVRDDPDLAGMTPEGIRTLLRQYVLDGNTLTTRQETRQEYLEGTPDDPFWYRAVIPVSELPRGLFVEVRLIDDDPDEPWVEIVSAHQQK